MIHSTTDSICNETYEVPIMLSPDIHLTYEDIAKLNPFYEEYRAFWNTFPDTTATTVSSIDASSRSSSLHSVHVDIDILPSPVDVSSSPTLRYPRSYIGVHLPRKLDIPLHKEKQHHPSIRIFDEDLTASQYVSFVHDSQSRILPSIYEATEMNDHDTIDACQIGAPLQPMRSSHKKLFGTNGWLGNTSELRDVPLKRQKSGMFRDLGKKIKHHVGEIAEDMAKSYPKPFAAGLRRPKLVPGPTIPISLDPPTQARLYSEMEVMICQTANRFLIQQYKEGCVSEESIRKVTNFWGSKNRPQVVEFQFDQATQRRLILLNIRTLRFNGESSTNPILLHSNLHNWKAVVKEMSIRTFCAPDSAIRKHMHDIHKLLDMLNAHNSTFITFEGFQMQIFALMSECRQSGYRLERSNSTYSGSSGRPAENNWIAH